MNIKLVRKDHFKIQYISKRFNTKFKIQEGNIGRLTIQKSFTNIFVTLTDISRRFKVIHSSSAGACTPSNSKRRKVTPQAIELIMNDIMRFIELYGITQIHLVLKMKVNILVRFLIKELAYHNIRVINVKTLRPIAHNGMRQRKVRRS